MRIYWLNPPISTRTLVVDTAWVNFSSYMRQHDWIEPIIDWSCFETVEDILEDINSKNPDIICMSTYMWNERLCLEVAKEIKKQRNVTIVRGGPQQTSNDNIDYNCHPVGIGELYLSELLSNIENGNLSEVQSVVKTRYTFPEESSLEHNIVYLTNLVGVGKQLNKNTVINYETTRGCPYACTYCEWGGGVGVKISQKPEEQVFKELELISMLGFHNLDLIDANFGILPRDVKFMQAIADNKKIYGFPKVLLVYGIAKSKVQKKEAILDIAFENGLMDYYSMSIQSVSKEALVNVKRVDVPLEDNLKLAKKYYDKYGYFAKIEIIMGLPGNTIESFYEEMNLVKHTGRWDWYRGPLSVLPATELSDPLYRRLHKIKTALVGVTENDDNDITFVSNCVLDKYKSKQEVVVETYSFTKEEWKEMFFMNYAQAVVGPTLSLDSDYAYEMRKFYKSIQNEDWFINIKNELDKLADGKRDDKDFLLYDGMTIQEWVRKYLGSNNQTN